MAENIFRLKRIAKKDPYVTPNTAVEKHIYDAVHEGGGGGAGVYVVNATMSGNTFTCDKTAAEMFDACQTGVVLIRIGTGENINILTVIAVARAGSAYTFICSTGTESGNAAFTTTGGDSYPQATKRK